MSVPNRLDIVGAVYARYDRPLATTDDIGRFTEAVVVVLRATGDRRWGHLRKNPGQTQYAGHAANAVLYLSDMPGQSVAVDIMRVGDPNPMPRWLEDIPRYSAGDWYAPADVPTPVPTPGRRVKLGVSAFGALGLYRHDRARFDEMIRFFRDDLRPDYARIFWYLADGPWGIVGTGHLTDLARRDLLLAVIEELLAIGVKPQLTVFGTWVADANRRGDLVEQFRSAARPFAQRLFLVDCYNEPGAIGVPEYGYVRGVGRALASEGYPLLSLASPDTLHMGVQGREATDAEVAADVSKLYDAMPVAINAITPHWGRHPWRPHRQLGPSAVGKTIINDEPRGYKSSVSAIEDPADFGRDIAASAAAGEAYTLHCEPGIWHGYCDTRGHPDWEHNNSVKRWQDVPRIVEIVAALHAVRDGGTVPAPGPLPGGGRPRPYPGDPVGASIGDMVFAQYAEKGEPPNPGMAVHIFRTSYDINAGMAPESAIAKRKLELRGALGLPAEAGTL